MPKVSKQDIREVVRLQGYEGRLVQLGSYTVAFETYTEDSVPAELFKGLPDGRCQCPRWGVQCVTLSWATSRYSGQHGLRAESSSMSDQ